MFMMATQISLIGCLVVTGIGAAILVTQLFYAFIHREY